MLERSDVAIAELALVTVTGTPTEDACGFVSPSGMNVARMRLLPAAHFVPSIVSSAVP